MYKELSIHVVMLLC